MTLHKLIWTLIIYLFWALGAGIAIMAYMLHRRRRQDAICLHEMRQSIARWHETHPDSD